MNKDENRNTPYHKLEWIHFAIQEAMNGNIEELDRALPLVRAARRAREHAMEVDAGLRVGH